MPAQRLFLKCQQHLAVIKACCFFIQKDVERFIDNTSSTFAYFLAWCAGTCWSDNESRGI